MTVNLVNAVDVVDAVDAVDSVDASRGGGGPAEFGRRLRSWRRRAGLTQKQLGRAVGYDHSVVSRLETGLREPPWALVRLLDSVLGTGGELAAALSALPEPRQDPGPRAGFGPGPGAGHAAVLGPAPGPVPGSGADPGPGADPGTGAGPGHGPGSRSGPGPRRSPADAGLFAVVPGGAAQAIVPDAALWPLALPAEGIPCPVHGTAGCVAPWRAEALPRIRELTASEPDFVALAGAETEVLHAVAAVLAGLVRRVLHGPVTGDRPAAGHGLATVEGLLRAVVRWAAEVDSAGREPLGQLRIAAQYAQIAGRLRMRRGQSGIAMAWFAHGLRWAEAAADLPARATLLSDTCTLVRLDADAQSALGYARAIGAVDRRRRWVAALSHLYQARGYALAPDADACHRHIALARRTLAQLGPQDHEEAPWLTGVEGEMRLESAVGGALRDLAAATGDRTTALRAVDAVARSRDRLPPGMRDTHVLLTLRLADGWACAGDPGAAVDLAAPTLDGAVRSRELLVGAELSGLNRRLLLGWGDLPEVRTHRERLLAAGLPAGSGFAGICQS